MQCYVCYQKTVLRYKFLNLDTRHMTTISVRIRGYFSTPKGVLEKKIRETLLYLMKHCYRVHLSNFFSSRFKIC